MSQGQQQQQQQRPQVPAIAGPRLPYHPMVEERFGIGKAQWMALVDAIFPTAKTPGAVILALAYCQARKLDPFKKVVHIVPIWDKERRCEVETVWPGIAEHRTTAARTKLYAGHDKIEHGPMITRTWPDGEGEITVTFPEWSQMTVYRLIDGQRCAFPGPEVYWLETYAAKKNDAPNTMWRDRPIGMLDKCAEANALRGAFPEELGEEPTEIEASARFLHGRAGVVITEKPSASALLTQETASPADYSRQAAHERAEQKQQQESAPPFNPPTQEEVNAAEMSAPLCETADPLQWHYEQLGIMETEAQVNELQKQVNELTLSGGCSKEAEIAFVNASLAAKAAIVRAAKPRGRKPAGQLFGSQQSATEAGN